MLTRRDFLHASLGALAARTASAADDKKPAKNRWAREVGITTGSFMRHLSVEAKPGKLRLLDLPKLMHDELDMKVIDLMTATLASQEPAYLEQLRSAADKAGCILTNLKMNNRGIDMDSPDRAVREKAIDEYKRTIDAAARLGVRWVRPLPGLKRPDMDIHVVSYRALIDYAAPKGIQLLIENNGWLRSDANGIPEVIKAVDRDLAASPDTGNWDNQTRYDGLAKAFPLAVTCDFKALKLGPNGEHEAYDLKRCFQIAWDAGFRGPWCLEHFHDDLKSLYREFALLRDLLRQWMAKA